VSWLKLCISHLCPCVLYSPSIIKFVNLITYESTNYILKSNHSNRSPQI
jgi:hypothetical protein